MRVIGGQFKGRRFYPPKNIPTRPTTDFAKEGLFNFLNNYYNFDKIKYLDLFAGTGSLSYEMASRGCTDITCVELFPACAAFIQKTVETWEIEGLTVKQMDVFKFIDTCKDQYDVIFAGPPYALGPLPKLPDLVFKHDLIEGRGWFILEHNPNHSFSEHPHFLHLRKYGGTLFSIFARKE